MHFLSMKFLGLILLQFSLAKPDLLQKLQLFQQDEGIQTGIVAASIVKTNNNVPVLSYHDQTAINSASTLKLITTATALSFLGKAYRFETELAYTGEIVNGVLQGNLHILPGGDPSLGSPRGNYPFQEVLNEFSRAVKGAGIRRVAGKIIVQDQAQFHQDVPDSWIWGDLGNYYGAVPAKFNINENYYTVYFKAGRTLDDPAEIMELVPHSSSWLIINEVKTGPKGSGDQVYIYSSPGSATLRMTGTVPLGSTHFAVKGSIPDPALLFTTYLRESLTNNGIQFDQDETRLFPEDLNLAGQKLHTLNIIRSETLADLARECNYHSINLYADAFLKKVTGLSFKNSPAFVKEFWELRDLKLDGFQIKDGSGLSPSGFITAKNMTDILSKMTQDRQFPAFLETIPVVGEDGSVKYKDSRGITGGRLRAKSGSIEGTRAYAGYFNDKSGDQYAFMICVNHYEPQAATKVRRFLDDFLIDMAKN